MAGGNVVSGIMAGVMIHVVINALLPTLMGFVKGINLQSGYVHKIGGYNNYR